MEMVFYETAGPYVEEFTRRAGAESTRTSENHNYLKQIVVTRVTDDSY